MQMSQDPPAHSPTMPHSSIEPVFAYFMASMKPSVGGSPIGQNTPERLLQSFP